MQTLFPTAKGAKRHAVLQRQRQQQQQTRGRAKSARRTTSQRTCATTLPHTSSRERGCLQRTCHCGFCEADSAGQGGGCNFSLVKATGQALSVEGTCYGGFKVKFSHGSCVPKDSSSSAIKDSATLCSNTLMACDACGLQPPVYAWKYNMARTMRCCMQARRCHPGMR